MRLKSQLPALFNSFTDNNHQTMLSMKNWFKILPLVLAIVFAVQFDANAQYYGKKKKKKKKPAKTEQSNSKIPSRSKNANTWEFKDRLWYGTGFNLGFSGANGFSVFNIGLTPMVGYKIIEPLSVGPRIGLNYSYIKGIGTDNLSKVVQPVSFEYGVFARYKILPIIFAHVEYTRQNEEIPLGSGSRISVDPQTGNPETIRNQTNDVNFGLGYNSGGDLSYEIMLLYDAIDDDDVFANNPQLPFSIRVGFNYKF